MAGSGPDEGSSGLTERAAREASGWGMASAAFVLVATGIGLFAVGIAGATTAAVVTGALLAVVGAGLARGLTPVSPGQARVIQLLGRYTGTALSRIAADGLVELDEERKAAMVSNLLVVLCSDHATQPVVNTGTLYQ